MAITPVILNKTVTTAGTQIQITTDTTIKPSTIIIEGTRANTGFIYVGLSDVSSTDYIASLDAGERLVLNSNFTGLEAGDIADFQLSDLWVDSSVNGETCQVTYFERVEA